jgi:hypothetical protein
VIGRRKSASPLSGAWNKNIITLEKRGWTIVFYLTLSNISADICSFEAIC